MSFWYSVLSGKPELYFERVYFEFESNLYDSKFKKPGKKYLFYLKK